jgi:hypothetical protein
MSASLGDAFPESLRKTFAKDNIIIGSVIFSLFEGRKETKEKRFVVIGTSPSDDEVAVLVFNSNKPFVGNPHLEPLQIHFTEKGKDYLSSDCFLNCAHLEIISYKGLNEDIVQNPEHILGTMSTKDLSLVCSTASKSRVISPKNKSKFGLP